MGGWAFPIEEFRRMSAYNALKYLVIFRPKGIGPRFLTEIDFGAWQE